MTGTGGPALPEHLRRRLDAVFGDVLPEVTRDEAADASDAEPAAPAPDARDPDAAGRGAPASGRDAWLRANRPPHHDQG